MPCQALAEQHQQQLASIRSRLAAAAAAAATAAAAAAAINSNSMRLQHASQSMEMKRNGKREEYRYARAMWHARRVCFAFHLELLRGAKATN
jgi:hypothetical protein